MDEYIRRYTAGDVRGVTNLCHVPFLAVRRGEAIHMPDSGAVWDHFAAAIGAYRRAAGVETWNRLETDTRQSLARWRAVREATIRLLESLAPAEWDRTGMHQARGVMSVAHVARLLVDHDATHLDQIRAALAG